MSNACSIVPNVSRYRIPCGMDDVVAAIFHMAERSTRPDEFLRLALRRIATEEEAVHNLVTTVGLTGLAYNCTAAGDADGDVVDAFLVGSSTTAAALADTALGTQLASYEDFWSVSTRGVYVVGYHLTGPKRNARDGDTISEIGLQTNNSGSGKASDNILFARAVLYTGDRIAIDDATTVVYIWSFVFRWAGQSGGTGLDFGLQYFATRMRDLSVYGALSHIAVGTGTTAQDTWLDTLVAEATPRQAFTFTSSGAQVSASGTITAGTVGGDLTEIGPAVGASNQVLYQCLGVAGSDNTANNTAVSAAVTFANVVTVDKLQLESADFLLLESGDVLLLES